MEEDSGVNGGSNFDDDEKALKGLLEAFGAAFSLDQIASAYCKAGKNADVAAEALALCTAPPNVGGEAKAEAKPKPKGEEEEDSSQLPQYNVYRKPSYHANGNSRGSSKAKYRPISAGSVSSIIGKQYQCVRKTPSSSAAYNNGACNASKPSKQDPKVLPMSEIWVEKEKAEESNSSSRDDCLHRDMEDFLFSMLGDGFKLERERIRQVLDSCGYDMEKSMEKLVNFPASTSELRNELVSTTSDKSADLLCLKPEVFSERQYKNSAEGNEDGALNTNGVEFTGQRKERNDLQKEVLAALFGAPERPEEIPEKLPRRAIKAGNGYGAYGGLVVEPPQDFTSESKSAVVYQQHHGEDDADDEDSYQLLRKAVKEYRTTWKEYYRAAVDAFRDGDRDRVDKLLEQWHFFLKKSREADEESNTMILKTRNVETQGEIVLDLHECGAKEAIRLLKCQISSFCGIASIKYLKVIIDTKEGHISKASRRRLLVLKLLQEESINWTEGENAGTILIQSDTINRKKLSFLK